jgi:hypothetical protein
MNLLGQFMVEPLVLNGPQKALLILPLCLAIAIVYKVTRLRNLKELPRAVFALWITIVIGMYSVGLGLWAIHALK